MFYTYDDSGGNIADIIFKDNLDWKMSKTD